MDDLVEAIFACFKTLISQTRGETKSDEAKCHGLQKREVLFVKRTVDKY